MSTTRPLEPVDRQVVLEILWTMKRQIDLLGWHVTQMRPGVDEEIADGLFKIDEALKRLSKR